jgi:hypothetical protein
MRKTNRSLAIVVALLGMLAVPSVASAQGAWWNTTPEVNKDLPPGLTPYHEVAPKLREIERRSNRVQVEVIGQSAQGRDLYLVTVSEPSAHGRFGRYKALRNLMLRDPAAAQERAAEFEDFKVPVFVNGSIHGNEWEGVDASLALIERLAFADDAETKKVLENTIVLFNVVQNPDGRVLGQRPNGNGFDVNRDFITLSQPESRATVRQMIEWHPMVFLDLHGYVNPYLIEPATPPHNPNYEYDLYIKWALDQAEAMEGALNGMGLQANIPFRDDEEGWDDWPPIFTPMYAMYHGAYAHTMEAPLQVNNASVNLPATERERRADINKRAHMATVWAALNFASDNRREMVHDQIEVFRRGFLDEPQVPIGDEYGEQHEFLAEFPEAWVIPMGDGQRSDVSAIELVNHLLANDVQVRRATRPFTADGHLYDAGSYIVPMQQPKRGLANTILEPGYDITDVVSQMYDISGWSLGELWGANRAAVPDGQAIDANTAPVKQRQLADGGIAPGAGGYALRVDSAAAVAAVNELLDAGVALKRTDDGTVYAPASAGTRVQRLASSDGLDFTRGSAPAGAEPLEDVEVAAAASADELFVLERQLGFEVDAITNTALNGGAQLDDYDVLFVSTTGVRYQTLNATGKQEVNSFRAAGGGIVGRGSNGARFNDEAGVLDVSYTVGRSDANRIAAVDNQAGSPLTTTAPEQTFVYSPIWFTRAGSGAKIAQRFDGGDFFFSGHWTGQSAASGQGVIVEGESGGGRAVVFGSNPLFRAHPRGLYPQAAHALWWSGSK